MPAPVYLELVFLDFQPAARVFELALKEQARVLGKTLAIAEVLFDVERCQPFRDLARRSGIAARISDLEGLLAIGRRVDLDVAAHLLDDVLHDGALSPVLPVQVVVGDDALEPRPAEDLVVDRSQAIFDAYR